METMQNEQPNAGEALLRTSREKMCDGTKKIWDFYEMIPGAPLQRREFGYYCLERWNEQGLSPDANLAQEFQYDPPRIHYLGQLGWCEAGLNPVFEEKILQDLGDHELVQDFAGRGVLCFKGRRSGFMPEYRDHPVKDLKTWEENVKWRMNPDTPERYTDLPQRMKAARDAAAQGMLISQNFVGGYMYLRSLIGPEALLYGFYMMPEVLHSCMKTWLELADAVIARHQQYVTIDELFLAEDICYKGGCLISPALMQEFLFPYYQQLLANMKARQLDKTRHLYVQIDTDGFVDPVIQLYMDAIGMDVMSPFEVAAGCDVVRTAKQYPNLRITGGIDKRIMAKGSPAIDEHLEAILPFMRQRGGYIPTCDHGVPEEVSLQDYRHYRKRCIELGG